MDWPFDKAPDCTAITTTFVHQMKMPILSVTHYLDDNSWAFKNGAAEDSSYSVLLTMEEIINKDKSLLEISDLPPGWSAIRSNVGSEWHRHKDNDLFKKTERFDFMKHGEINANVKLNFTNIFHFFERNVVDFKTFGWGIFILHIFTALRGAVDTNSQSLLYFSLSTGAILNIVAIVGLILFISKEEFRNRDFLSRLVPYIGCLLLWLFFVCVYSYTFAKY